MSYLQTSTVFEAVKKDLDELSTAVKTEASYVGAAIENTLKVSANRARVCLPFIVLESGYVQAAFVRLMSSRDCVPN